MNTGLFSHADHQNQDWRKKLNFTHVLFYNSLGLKNSKCVCLAGEIKRGKSEATVGKRKWRGAILLIHGIVTRMLLASLERTL